MAKTKELRIPAKGLVLLVGVSGSGKSTFAQQHFLPTQIVSSDNCRAQVSDSPNDQSATPDAFELLNAIVGIRLRRGLMTVVDATNVQPAARQALVEVAKQNDALVDAIVLDVNEQTAISRVASRDEGQARVAAVTRQAKDLKRSLKKIRGEGFRKVYYLNDAELDAAFANPGSIAIVPEKPWNDLSDQHGPFDIIGDVHGCLPELLALLTKLGWQIATDDDGHAISATHPEGRKAVFLGDLVDRGPDSPGVLRLVMGMVDAGTALCVSGNHEAKLVKALNGKINNFTHGLEVSMEQFSQVTPEFRKRAIHFLGSLVSHYVLDDGRLVVAHAGLKEKYHGRTSQRVRAFALYGDTTGESDEFGLPVRWPWAQEYRGDAMVVYGHTPVPEPEWINNTICLDTGAVFGGALTALRYPEKQIVQVPAARVYAEPVRPLVAEVVEDREPTALRIDDVAGTRWLDTEFGGRVKIPEENAAAALEVMSQYAVDPRWLIYLPPTMAPAHTSTEPGYLEYPTSAFNEYAAAGIKQVVCEEKHMGSRAIAVVARDGEVARRRFGIGDGSTGAVYSRTGRPFFPEVSEALVAKVRLAIEPLFADLDTDWLALDCELLPWSARALPLIKDQFAAIGAAAHHGLPAATATLTAALERGLDVDGLLGRMRQRLDNAEAFRNAYAAYVQPTDGLAGVSLAPFQILAGEREVYAATRSHKWQLEQIAKLADSFIRQTRHFYVDLDSDSERERATQWWLDLTAAGGEGMVVKPLDGPAALAEFAAQNGKRGKRVQPGLKVRGREYLRIIYGPDYLDSLDQLRNRSLERKKSLATREYGLGLESLTRFVDQAPLYQVHQYAFGVLALESEPVDPRL